MAKREMTIYEHEHMASFRDAYIDVMGDRPTDEGFALARELYWDGGHYQTACDMAVSQYLNGNENLD